MERLTIRPRYHRWSVDPGVEWIEANTTYAYLDWAVPISQCGLVLIDVWDRHYLEDTMARSEEIVQRRIVPLVGACRENGLRVIHAPSPVQAKEFPQWVGRETAHADLRAGVVDEEWPPPSFRHRQGEYAQFARPAEPRAPELAKLREDLEVHPDVLPTSNEPVVATGDELHALCKREGILVLFFLGFNTNACILERDYGLREMGRRGYTTLLVRDCTTGMESAATHERLGQTEATILNIEMFLGYTVTSDEMIRGMGS